VLPLRLIAEPDDRADLPSLISSAQGGDRGAFSRLAERVERTVRGWAEAITGDRDDADDVTQDVLILLHRRLPQFEGKSRFSTWLYRITRNVALDRQRRIARRGKRMEAMDPAPVSVIPRENLDDATVARLVLHYFDQLPSRQREVFELADIHGLTAQEIAERLGLKAVTVRANLFKARRTIRERMLAHHSKLLEEYRS
jgi:RNA polymerase sigma-70 factor (ECF subfamily)